MEIDLRKLEIEQYSLDYNVDENQLQIAKEGIKMLQEEIEKNDSE